MRQYGTLQRQLKGLTVVVSAYSSSLPDKLILDLPQRKTINYRNTILSGVTK